MRLALIGAAMAMLGGCATMASEPEPVAASNPRCEASAANGLIGREASQELAAEALRLTGARGVRWKPPGAIVTMDYRPDRLNIDLNDKNVVTGFTCG